MKNMKAKIMTELTENIELLSSINPETINAWAGLVAILVAGLAIWTVHRANRGKDN
jgi:hypothetical protein